MTNFDIAIERARKYVASKSELKDLTKAEIELAATVAVSFAVEVLGLTDDIVADAPCSVCDNPRSHYFHSGKTTKLVVEGHPNQQHDFKQVVDTGRFKLSIEDGAIHSIPPVLDSAKPCPQMCGCGFVHLPSERCGPW